MKLIYPLMTATLAVLLTANAQAADKKHSLSTAPQKSEPVAVSQESESAPQKNEPAPESPPKKSEPAAGATWTEPKSGMEFVWIPSGCFQMGGDGDKNEQPVHKVCVKGYYLGKYEVTQAQYQQVMGKNPSHFRGDGNPVEQVSWHEAKSFIEEINYSASVRLRLPSEAEWEYACRAGGEHETYCSGGGRVDRFAWYEGNSGKTTHPVGQLAANAWGLYDMSGNVWEWVEDCYNENYNGAPSGGTAWKVGSCERRVLRGGSWFYDARNTRAANRVDGDPALRNNNYGFRLARTLP